MLIVKLKEGESINRALKRLKKKFDKANIIKKIREKKHFIKPSVKKKQVLTKAKYIQSIKSRD